MARLEQTRRLVTEIPGPASLELSKRRAAAVSHAVNVSVPVFVARAGGGIVEDVDGNRLIDLGSGIAVTTIGNSAPRVVDAVRAQVAEFTHTCFMVTPYESYVAVAEMLNRITPGAGDKRSVLFNSGAEAVENAVKVARAYTRKPAVVAFDHAYHGRTNLAMALTAKSMPYKGGFGPFAPEIYRAPLSYPYRDGLLDKELATDGEKAAARAINIIDGQIGADSLAAVIIEPIQGEGGFIVPVEGFLPTLLDWCRRNDVLFIADEVQTGFARSGAMFACEHEGPNGLEPDLICTAKAIADGLPLSAVTGRAQIMDAPHVGGLGGTFGGNPLACAAALATIETIESDGLIERARQLERLITEPLLRLQARDDRIGDVRGRGAMIAIELVKSGTAEPDKDLTQRLSVAAHAAGVIVLTCGMFGNIIRLLPPLTISDELLAEGIDILGGLLADL
ncbi:4-aminobutyrate--2-oxoglutarate transaminase [Mycobacterium avium]|uniref:(S)-3-amino-2-methylpropionate transaminase n=1 Tax=Mycolicibacterium paratuberculosis (strain ATCC BAA-968 / K-10) TaxID=262316 RepID=Q741P8_MYCPA|nr:4-aminobutyrate--2-oxoglutarate transaminase [Mycobacterium avium]ELP47080.1 4-aminobutyrate aminotransferase [Mycobacterium avium subsp. paratuberculosis S5]ETB02458.1 4-aminobutyrate aminotransferase [Mycobacterium avium subsp. paratuberculosis 10-4404]ETB02575.1 4-aminobutyrate aminotransferase [Mycobacterium avium subsp. paratuberculosis 10-5864]ETB10598.1 4-aminobutyrate aminotransferase [Mycobacterium avium subsp. paratuberculosis 08-8281]ETB30406.1 4-aminobutyrate aminotransferase [M